MEENYPKINGIYKHYKGGVYQIITLAKNTETDENMVVYKSLIFGTYFVRPLKIFNENVVFNDLEIPRFKLLENF